MLKQTKKIAVAVLILIVFAINFFCLTGFSVVNADSTQNQQIEVEESEVSPRLLTTLTLTIGGENGYVWARVRNDFTLGFATVNVYVELYSSLTKQDSYTDMTFESVNYIEDLNLFQTVETKAPANGVQRYWIARAWFRADSGAWNEKVTSVWLFDGNGNVVV